MFSILKSMIRLYSYFLKDRYRLPIIPFRHDRLPSFLPFFLSLFSSLCFSFTKENFHSLQLVMVASGTGRAPLARMTEAMYSWDSLIHGKFHLQRSKVAYSNPCMLPPLLRREPAHLWVTTGRELGLTADCFNATLHGNLGRLGSCQNQISAKAPACFVKPASIN